MSRWPQNSSFLCSYIFRQISPALLTFAIVLALINSFVPKTTAQQALDVGGTPNDPFKEASGKLVVLVFIRTDCPISNRYAPLIQEMSVKYGQAATFWLVFPDKNVTQEQIRKYEQEYAYKLPALRDPEHALVKKSRVNVTPEVGVFDRKGGLVYHGRIDNLYRDFGKARREATTHELADAIEAASKGVAPAATSANGIGCFIADLK